MPSIERSVPRSVAPLLEALELEQPTLVTLSLLDELIDQTKSSTTAAHGARMLRERGWLLPLRSPGVWEFAPGARAGAFGGGVVWARPSRRGLEVCAPTPAMSPTSTAQL